MNKQKLKWLILFVFEALIILQLCGFLRTQKQLGFSIADLAYLGDFNHYYATASMVSAGESPYCRPLAALPLSPKIRWHETLPQSTNPPPLALLTVPLASFSIENAWLAWELLLIFSLAGSLFVIARELNWSKGELLFGLLILFQCSPSIQNLRFGQVQPLLLLTFVCGWSALRKGRATAGGLCWGVAAALKFYLWPLLMLLALQRKFKASAVAALAFAATLALPLIWMGSDAYSEFAKCGKPIIEKSALFFPMNYSLGGIIQHGRFVFGIPMLKTIDWPFGLQFYWFPLVTGAAALVYLERKYRGSVAGFDLAAFSAALLGVISSPVAWPHYFIFALALAAVCYRRENSGLLAVLLLSALAIPFQLPPIAGMSTAERSSFAFQPMVVWLLFFAAVYVARRERTSL